MNHGSLFTGEGGFDLAAEWIGWENVFHCELNDNLRWFLNKKWPMAHSYADIKSTDFTIYRGRLDLLSGGFPCQPYSAAGKRKGKEDDRHLWPEMLRAIREIQPKWIVGENVLGLVNWNGGLVFDEVQADLEAEGYEVQPYVLPAVSVNAPHRRDRVWFVAYNTASDRRSGKRQKIENENREKRSGETGKLERGFKGFCSYGNVTHSNSIRRGRLRNEIETSGTSKSNELYGSKYRIQDEKQNLAYSSNEGSQRSQQFREPEKENCRRQESAYGATSKFCAGNRWQDFPTQPPICSGNDGFSSESLRQLIREDSMGYLSEKEINKIFSEANSKWRKEVLMAGGNAVVPQVPLQIFKAIQEYTKQEQPKIN